MLCKSAVKEWQEIYKKQTGEEVSFAEATDRANRMFRFLKAITKVSSSNKFKQKKGGEIDNDKKAKSHTVRGD